MINWNDLRYFLAIHRAGSLGAAARMLKVDQTTVSRRLTAMEEELGVRLFDRTSDGLSLTTAGERMVAESGDMEERFGAIESVVRGSDAKPEGVVRVATSENLSVPFFLKRLLSVREKHPGIDIELITGAASVNLLRREADVALRLQPRALPAQQNLVARKVGSLGLTLYATKGYLDTHPPVSLADGLAGHDVVLFDGEIADTSPGKWMADSATAGRAVLRVNSLLGAAAAAATGGALALTPCFMTELWPNLVRATPGNVLSNDMWILAHAEILRTARVRAVVDHVAEQIAAAKDMLVAGAKSAAT